MTGVPVLHSSTIELTPGRASTASGPEYSRGIVGRDLQEILSPAIWTHVEPLYDQCVLRGMPTYSVFTVVDLHNDVVAYERLLLPFGEQNVVIPKKSAAQCGKINNECQRDQRHHTEPDWPMDFFVRRHRSQVKKSFAQCQLRDDRAPFSKATAEIR